MREIEDKDGQREEEKRRGGGALGRYGKLGYAESENETEGWMKNGFQQPDKSHASRPAGSRPNTCRRGTGTIHHGRNQTGDAVAERGGGATV
ncbi:hypothetical protein EYF80_061481 [Liparis tanakae]|uniref:Uncharacterized protein n=1 Tax=Liparis tanakae TaxID=230148 RepID=A0A4Z2EIC6_9TELE|nr:hypothetical protein EYF80_061481 [Liparis tanakae]